MSFLAIGFLTPITSLLAALGWASLLHRGPMLAGPADDSMAILLWCLVIGSSGEHFSVDAILHKRLGWHVSRPRVRTRIAVGLLQVHAAVVSLAALLSQLKGDVWWNGSAVWWIATRKPGQVVDITGLLSQSEYLCNIFTHGVIAWEAFVAVGIWFTVLSENRCASRPYRMAIRRCLDRLSTVGIGDGYANYSTHATC